MLYHSPIANIILIIRDVELKKFLQFHLLYEWKVESLLWQCEKRKYGSI